MSSRFPPSSGFSSRGDRSPQRYADRRPVSPPPAGGRDDPNTAPLGREPPRGPKALIDSSRGGYSGGGGRGRGGGYPPSRGGEFRDRDRDRDRERPGGRDFRDGPPFRRDDRDRDWVRRDRIDRDFDARDGRPAFRRSRSPPPPRDARDFRDSRDSGSDIVRMRRNSRDSLVSTSSNPNDGPPVGIGPPPHRGGPGRGRGRGDWEGGGGGRGRGRGHFVDDRDPFRRRSRSRDGWWDRDRDRDRDRDFRDRDRDHPRDVRDRDFDRRTDRFDRRDDDRRVERDERDRPADAWKKDGGPVSRPDIRIPSGPRSSSIPPSASSSTSRGEPPKNLDQPGPDQFRKIPTAPARDFRRDSDRADITPARTEALRDPVLPKGSPPPSAPQVPAFGSVTLPPTVVSTDKPPQPSTIPQTTQPTAPKADRPASSSAASVNSSKEVPKEAPTEPKALRNENNVPHQEPRPRRESMSEPWRQDIPPRVATTKAPPTGPAASPNKSLAELSPPTAPAALLKRESALESRPPNDSFMSTSPPQGPASTSPILARAQLSPSGRGGSPQTSPRMSFSSVPTGPRAGVRPSGPWPARGGHAKSKQWVRPGYPRGPPSTGGGGGGLGPRREYDDRDPSDYQPPVGDKRGDIDHRDLDERSEKAISEKPENANVDEPMFLDAMPRATSTKDEDEKKPEKPQEEEDIVDKKEKEKATPGKEQGLVPIPDFTRSSDEEDENEVFTEDYVQERKALFERSIRALKAELPPPTLQDPVIVDLLMKVQLLGMIADGSAPEEPEPSAVETNVEQSKKVLPAETYKTEMEIDEKESVTAPAAEVTVAPPESVNKELITVESLPFLNSGPLTPLSELDVYQENSQIHERLKETTRNALSKQRQETSQNNKQLREEFASFYRPWRMAVQDMDDKKQSERKSSSPAASTPPVTPLPPPIPDGREGRRYKGNSELDFQNALRASAISAQEESERRRRTEATARPDLDREAVVPNMLPKYEVKPGVYKDTNNCVEVNDAFAVYGFYPPEDDFTPEEHKLFTDAFMAYPKKWGKIADELPGRTFSQCIMHYYLTKEEIKYKAKLNKRWRSQRRARKSTTRPKSNALMSDLKADGEDEETVQMTETGRPRRAAAPTFGGDAATEVETSRRGGAKDSDQGEKPASKRGRGGGPGTRGGRRGRGGGAQAQQQLPAPASSSNQPPAAQLSQTQFPATIAPHQPLAPATSIPPGVPLIAKQEAGTRDIHSAESMIRIKEHEREATEEFIPKPARSSRNRIKDPIYVFEAAGGDHDVGGSHKPSVEMGGYGSMQPTSYWSVPEVRDFPVLLAHFGMDYDGIAGFMKTKTPVMVRNYYQRKLDSGNHEFEEIVKVAEAKKMRGEPTGPLPTPNPTPKRRYEATPSAVSHRPLAPHTDVDHPDDVRLSQKRVSSAMSPPPVQMRPAPDLAPDRNMGRYPPLAQATAAPLAAMPDDSRAIRQSGGPPAPRPFSGPRMGFFTEGREPRTHSGTSTLAASRGQDLQPSPRVAATQGPPHPDFARLEPLPPQTLRSRVDMHVPGQYQQGAPPPLYMQQAQQGGAPGQFAQAITGSHSRHPSLNKAPGSPAQGMPKHTPDVSPIRRSSFGQSQPPPSHYQYGPPIHQSSTLSPVKEPPTRSSATPAPQEPPRQVPAKRSNIMSILNDDAEEPPPPRKRFASEMTSSPRMSAYGMAESGGVQGSHLRHEEKPAYYSSQAPQSQQAGRYSDYPSYPPPSLGGSSASGPPNHDWMARFDPRSQSQQPTEVVRATPTPTPAPASQYGSGYQPPSNSQPPTPSQSNPPGSSHRGYQGYQGAPTPPHLTPSGRDAPPPSSSSVYRHQNAPSPQPRQSVLSYSSRQAPSPAQSPAAPMSIPPPRQSSGPGPYSPSMAHLQAAPPPSHPLGPQHRHSHSGHQSYQQHVQAMVSGQQQQPQHSSRPSLGLSGGPPTTTSYTSASQHGGPPPPHGTSRSAPLSNPPPQSLGIGRPFTPPAGVHAPPPPAPSIGGMLYPPNSSSAGHLQHHASYSRHPEPSGPPPPPGHHRVYSQGGSRQ